MKCLFPLTFLFFFRFVPIKIQIRFLSLFLLSPPSSFIVYLGIEGKKWEKLIATYPLLLFLHFPTKLGVKQEISLTRIDHQHFQVCPTGPVSLQPFQCQI